MTLTDQLKRDEGLRLTAYKDSLGYGTIGYGHKLLPGEPGEPITQEQAECWLAQDIAHATSTLVQHLPWVANLDDARRGVLINMTYNIGVNGLLEFVNMLAAVRQARWVDASAEMLKSKWANQVGQRAVRLSQQVLTGRWV